MPRFARNAAGETIMLDPLSGEWRPASSADLAAADANPVSAAFRGAQRAAGNLGDLARMGAAVALGSAAPSAAQDMAQAQVGAVTEAAGQRMAAREQESEAYRRQFPVSTLLGENADIVAGVAGGVGALARNRVAARVQRAAQGSAAQLRDQLQGPVGSRVEMALKTLNLSPITTDPLVRNFNRKLVTASVARRIGGEGIEEALQQSGGRLTAEVLDEAVDNSVRLMSEAIPDNLKIELGDTLAGRLQRLGKTTDFLEPEDLAAMELKEVTGRQVRQLRTAIGKIAAKSEDKIKADFARNTVRMMDRQLEQTAGVNQALYKEGASAYRVWVALRRNSAAISPEGFINAKSFRNAIRQTYGDAAKRGSYDSFDADTADLMRLIDRAVELGVQGAPDSGTAQRLVAGAVGAAAGVSFLN